MDTKYLNPHDDLFVALLPEDQEYQVLVTDDPDIGEWNELRVTANYVEVNDGNLEFYQVDEDVSTFVAGFPAGWYGPYGRAYKDQDVESWVPTQEELAEFTEELKTALAEQVQQPKIEREEYEDALLQEGLSPEVASQLADLLGRTGVKVASEAIKDFKAPAPAVSIEEERAQIRADLKQGVFPPDDLGSLKRPEKLKNVWEQQGNLDSDPLTGYTGEHAIGTPAREEEHQANLERLRREADASFVPGPGLMNLLDLRAEDLVEPWHGRATGSA